ncbi:type II toxin-antitoxin system RelE/ParE family toxin [Martelella alba]|uniref:Type II toxin-antitoxin system RelE/ParE family toxin n=1 Tax=Martelella alba TaxID=2590451 RepID=A0A506U307_9HYPH|nr:type II toxin-antitoxin system RelE/ParE family toxin [Martelella alba]TPW26969.1 type II toxin-antitoxin system RelE/ParE family toxin [Martelella alba]
MRQLPVYLLESALNDIDEIAEYVARVSSSLEVALDFTDRIERRCMKIGNAPYGGVARDDLHEGIRMVPFESSAVILYRVTDSTIEIVNVFHGGRDYDTIMRGSDQ